MGYTKKWIPPTIPLRNNLLAWKLICNDIHDHFIESGLVQTDDIDQLDIDEVSELPADGTFAGFRMYRFNDALQDAAPIFIKLEFGCGIEGLSTARSRTIRIKVTVGASSTGSGIIADGVSFSLPQEYNSSATNTTQLTQIGWSAICNNEDRGFFGVAYGVDSRNIPNVSTNGSYYGSTLCFFIERTKTVYGVPTSDGFLVYYPSLKTSTSSAWSTNSLALSLGSYYSYAEGQFSQPQSQFNSRLDNNDFPYLDGKPNFMPIFTMGSDRFVSFSDIVQYIEHSVGPQTEVTIETIPGLPSKFICLGNRTSLSVSPDLRQQSAVAMLFE